jgi:hypothetical protein
VTWMMTTVILGLASGGGGVAVVGGRLSFPSEEVGEMALIMMMLGLGLRGGSDAVAAGGPVCHRGEGGSVIWMKTVGLVHRGEGGVVVEECLVCHREEEGEVIMMTRTTTMIWLDLGLQGEGVAVVEGCLVWHREEGGEVI